jgi:hypothetical protein
LRAVSRYNLEILARTIPARTIALLFAASGILRAAEISTPVSTPRFNDYPFDQWAAAPEHPAIKWELHLLSPQISVHQRLIERVQAVIPGAELEKRRGRGELVLLVRLEDSDGQQWRAGSRLDLARVQQGVKSRELTFSIAAFVRPGEYKVLVALVDSHTMEHSFTRRTLHVAPLKNDPLPQAWATLPPVEVLPAVDVPDSWFLPAVKGLLQFPIQSHPDARPAKVELLVNMTPSERSMNAAGTLRRNLSVVIPSLKALSGLNAQVQPPSAAVIDLTRQRIGFETRNAATLDWTALGKLLTTTNPGVIDAKSLAGQPSMRDYFAREVARRAGDSGAPRWLIILSGPFSFTNQEMTALPVLPADPNRHIVYLRFLSAFGNSMAVNIPGPEAEIGLPRRIHGPIPGLGTTLPGGFGGPGGPGGGGRGRGDMLFPDDLERMLKAMGAQIVTVPTPEAFRKTIASLIAQIGKTQAAAN